MRIRRHTHTQCTYPSHPISGNSICSRWNISSSCSGWNPCLECAGRYDFVVESRKVKQTTTTKTYTKRYNIRKRLTVIMPCSRDIHLLYYNIISYYGSRPLAGLEFKNLLKCITLYTYNHNKYQYYRYIFCYYY